MRHGSGCVAELNVLVLCGCFKQVGLMTEAIGEYYRASAVGKIKCSFLAGVAFGDVCLSHILNTEFFTSRFCSVDEVEVIGGVFIVKIDESDLELLVVVSG